MTADMNKIGNVAQMLVGNQQASQQAGRKDSVQNAGAVNSQTNSKPDPRGQATELHQGLDMRAALFGQHYDSIETNLKAIRKTLDILDQWQNSWRDGQTGLDPQRMIEQAQERHVNLLKGDAIKIENNLMVFGEDLTRLENRSTEIIGELSARLESFLQKAQSQKTFIQATLANLFDGVDTTSLNLNDEGANLLALQIKQDLQDQTSKSLALESRQAILSLY